MNKLQVFANISIVIALYYLVYFLFLGITNPIPQLGDSFDYHIPIAKSILDGTFINGSTFTGLSHYYPGTSEALNSFFIFFNIPLTLTNIFVSVLLAFSCYFLARSYKIDKYLAIIFSLSIFTLNAVLRWMNAVNIDTLVGVYFVWALFLLKNSKETLVYFFKLGVVFGLLIGSKYTTILFSAVLFVFYIKDLIKVLNLKNIISFLIPFSVLGLFWYFRNFLLTTNPFYPMPFFNLPGKNVFNGTTILSVIFKYPIDMLNAFFSEYKLWFLSIVAVPIILFKERKLTDITKLFLLGIINFVLFLFFPTDNHTWIMVSSFRYSYPIFIPLMLGIFLYFKKIEKEELLSYFVVLNMLGIFSISYQPKLLIIVGVLSVVTIYLINKK